VEGDDDEDGGSNAGSGKTRGRQVTKTMLLENILRKKRIA
jgi:hypothetical protein